MTALAGFLWIQGGNEGYFEKIGLAIVFIMLGHYLYGPIERIMSKYRHYSVEVFIFLFVVLCGIAWYNGACAVAANIYNDKYLFLLTSFIGVILVMLVSRNRRSQFLLFFGQNSLIVFITHFGIQRIINALLRSRGIYAFTAYPFYLLFWGMMILVEIVIVLFVNKYVPFMFGKWKRCDKTS